jgi:hypothetical protein
MEVPMENTLLITGAENIAKALGISSKTLKRNFLGRPGFPACQLKDGGAWITTRDKLLRWVDNMVPDPQTPIH